MTNEVDAAAEVPDPAPPPHQPRSLAPSRPAPRRRPAPAGDLPYRRLLIGQGTAFIGSMLTQVAVPVQIYALTRSSLYVGFFGLAGLVPIIVFGLYGGAIADVVDRGRLYFWASIGTWLDDARPARADVAATSATSG